MEKKKYDKEYKTQWGREVEYLTSKGIRYVFVKTENGVQTYKYEKTNKLFEALAEMYKNK